MNPAQKCVQEFFTLSDEMKVTPIRSFGQNSITQKGISDNRI